MKIRDFVFLSLLFTSPSFVYGACSVANLTRCLDSACAINIGANPAARCQYCGSESAGEPEKSTAMKSISAGASAKYNISDKELYLDVLVVNLQMEYLDLFRNVGKQNLLNRDSMGCLFFPKDILHLRLKIFFYHKFLLQV